MRKILIVSNFFYPEITPRAFRVFELAKEFCRQGNHVTLILPNKEIYHKQKISIENLNIKFASSELAKEIKKDDVILKEQKLKNLILKPLKQFVKYFYPKELFLTYDKGITKTLATLEQNYDILISIAQPISIHLSVIIAKSKNKYLKKIAKSYAEFSDPLFSGSYSKVFPIYHLLGYFFSYHFKYFSIPTKNSVKYFSVFKTQSRIKVIPQGFNFDDIKIGNNMSSKKPIFAYAGSFYPKLRNPRFFFEYLTSLNYDFDFIIYTKTPFVEKMIDSQFPLLANKIIFKEYIPREKLIFKLSEVDFLINFNNENSLMVPSKLIDYALSKRPILSFNSKSFDKLQFEAFLSSDYSTSTIIDVNNFSIKNIAKIFY